MHKIILLNSNYYFILINLVLSYFTKCFLGDVNMNFYQLLQLGPQQLKQQVLEEKDLRRQNYLKFILFLEAF